MGRNRKRRPQNITRKQWQSALMNDQQAAFYYSWLVNLACCRFKWENLPTEIDSRFLELSLVDRGLSVFFRDDDYDKYFACWASPSGKINMYQNPTHFIAYGANGFNKRLSADDCVPIWNNYTRTPLFNAISVYARRLADIDRTLDVNLAMQKAPSFITCEESQRLTVENMVKQWMGNEPIVIGDNLSLQGIQVGYISPGVEYIGDKLLNAKMVIWAEIMTRFGINNSDIRKGERVQSAEVESNNEQVTMSALAGLDCRRRACEAINRKYDLGVWVDSNVDYSSQNFAALTTMTSRLIGDDYDGD